MKTLEERKKDRFNFLEKMFEQKNRGGLQLFHTSKIAEQIGISIQEAELIVEYLEGEGLLKTHNDTGELISITHYGILEIEQALTKPSEPTEHFPPIINFINVENMHNSQIQQGSTNANQSFNFKQSNHKYLKEFIKLFEDKYSELPFKSEDDRNEAIAEVQTIKAQLESPRPKLQVINTSIQSVTNILEGFTGSMLATMLIEYLKR